MLLEDLVMLILAGTSVYFIGIPLFKLLREITPKRRNPVAEAKQRVEQAHLELEAARLNMEAEKASKEASKINDHLYEEVLEEDTEKGQSKL